MEATEMVWAITTIGDERPPEQRSEPFTDMLSAKMRSRTVGVFKTLEDAQSVPAEGLGDLSEAGWYKWLCIEQIEFGLYPVPNKRKVFWYEYQENKGWIKQETCPEILAKVYKHLTGFGSIG